MLVRKLGCTNYIICVFMHDCVNMTCMVALTNTNTCISVKKLTRHNMPSALPFIILPNDDWSVHRP